VLIPPEQLDLQQVLTLFITNTITINIILPRRKATMVMERLATVHLLVATTGIMGIMAMVIWQ
jgi:hypothetical protein